MRPSSTAAMAGSASGFIFIHHCFETSGSTTVLQRWHLPTLSLYGSIFSSNPSCLQLRDHLLARVVAIQAGEFPRRRGHLGVLVDHLDARQVVALAGFEVVGIVRRRDLHRARAESELGHVIENDRNLAIHQRQPHGLAGAAPPRADLSD